MINLSNDSVRENVRNHMVVQVKESIGIKYRKLYFFVYRELREPITDQIFNNLQTILKYEFTLR